MATDDRFKQYSEAGEEFLEAARSRAVEFLRELSRMGQSTQKQASDQVDDLVDAGRKGTDQVLDVIRKEIAGQLGALGLATKADLASLERRLGGTAPLRRTQARKAAPAARKAAASKARGSAAGSAAAKSAATKTASARGAGTTKSAGAAAGKKAATRKAAAKKAAPAKAVGTTKS